MQNSRNPNPYTAEVPTAKRASATVAEEDRPTGDFDSSAASFDDYSFAHSATSIFRSEGDPNAPIAAGLYANSGVDADPDGDPTTVHRRGDLPISPVNVRLSIMDTVSTGDHLTDGLSQVRAELLAQELAFAAPPNASASLSDRTDAASYPTSRSFVPPRLGVDVPELRGGVYDNDEEEATRVGSGVARTSGALPAAARMGASIAASFEQPAGAGFGHPPSMAASEQFRRDHAISMRPDWGSSTAAASATSADAKVATMLLHATPAPTDASQTYAGGASDVGDRGAPLPFGALRVPVANHSLGQPGVNGGFAARGEATFNGFPAAESGAIDAQPGTHAVSQAPAFPTAATPCAFGQVVPAPGPALLPATMPPRRGSAAAAPGVKAGRGRRIVAWVALAIVVGCGLPLALLVLRDRMNSAPIPAPTPSALPRAGTNVTPTVADPVVTGPPPQLSVMLPAPSEPQVAGSTGTSALPLVPPTHATAVRRPQPRPVPPRPQRPRTPAVRSVPTAIATPPPAASERPIDMSPPKPPAAGGILDDAL
jgi:hypothetical protein